MSEKDIELMEEHAFYESGLSSHGCLEKLDNFAKYAIKMYGRLLLKSYINEFEKNI